MKETSKKRTLNSAELRQKVIYYQSEAVKYKFLSEKYELLLSNALQSKSLDKEPVPEKKKAENKIDCTAYFNYSLIQEKEANPFIYGSFVLKNTGNESLTTPIICIKVNTTQQIIIGGKIGEVDGTEEKLINSFEEWSYLHQDWRQKWNELGELWLKPKQTTEIKPGEKLVFSGFDITFHNAIRDKQVIIEGYCYFQQLTTGVKSLNKISITL
ncbi:hypothetical protein AWH56_015830 [Anaerobacillus isosaccharinicus]|uniref:Uncharacterized protein n=1 Tax=Anaerobacillus isosaccharinicus TaxID=1532552 RepID=A0A1S2KVA3_9BACI|nr:hypothetical protein [Anaerobacillus isosaccharinicus]MBA5587629.1 hypothetical protein [Anaerobacillus isosaccharinicus]QOY34195.1 hypothetical protein AWH56_015830 [Anaerobacillus isosaccharinicus]